MPRLNNTIHSTTIAGQIYNRGVPPNANGFVQVTMNNFQMMKNIARYDKSLQQFQNIKK